MISVIIDFIHHSVKEIIKIFSFGCLTLTIIIIFFSIIIFLIVTGKYDPIPLILRWFY